MKDVYYITQFLGILAIIFDVFGLVFVIGLTYTQKKQIIVIESKLQNTLLIVVIIMVVSINIAANGIIGILLK